MRDAGKLAGATVAGIEMIETIKASGAENGYFEKWSGYQASVNTQKVKFAKLNQYARTCCLHLFQHAVQGLLWLIIGVWLTMQGAVYGRYDYGVSGLPLTSFTATCKLPYFSGTDYCRKCVPKWKE